MSSQSCTHIKVTGVRCGSPALRGEQFCYFHQRMHRGVRTPPQARLHPIALIEDEESIQTALMEVINALMRNTIDLKRAALILRALHIAVKNASRVKIDTQTRNAVTEIPEYEIPIAVEVERARVETGTLARQAKAKPSSPTTDLNEVSGLPQQSELDIPASAHPDPEPTLPRICYEPPPLLTAAERAAKRAELEVAMQVAQQANQQAEQQGGAPSLSRTLRQGGAFPAQVTEDGQAQITNHVGTDPLVRPAMPKASAPTTDAAAIKPNANAINRNDTTGKGTSSTRANQGSPKATASAAEGHGLIPTSNAGRKKPPSNVNRPPAPKERKNAAHAARHG